MMLSGGCLGSVRYVPCVSRSFYLANGQGAQSNWVAAYPIGLGGRSGTHKFCVVPGWTPLLISEGLLEDLSSIEDTSKGLLTLGTLEVTVALRRSWENPKTKQWRLPLCDFGAQGFQRPRRAEIKTSEV
eukprot:6673151-Pyramimonas_sp.AAC.1